MCVCVCVCCADLVVPMACKTMNCGGCISGPASEVQVDGLLEEEEDKEEEGGRGRGRVRKHAVTLWQNGVAGRFEGKREREREERERGTDLFWGINSIENIT